MHQIWFDILCTVKKVNPWEFYSFGFNEEWAVFLVCHLSSFKELKQVIRNLKYLLYVIVNVFRIHLYSRLLCHPLKWAFTPPPHFWKKFHPPSPKANFDLHAIFCDLQKSFFTVIYYLANFGLFPVDYF